MRSTYISALVIFTALVIWLGTGQLGSGETDADAEQRRTEQQLQREDTGLPVVRAQVVQAEPRVAEVVVRGRTEAKRKVAVRAETSGRIVNLPVEKGAIVEAGDLLCEIDIDDRRVRLAEAQAAVVHAQREYDGSLRLQRSGLQSEINIAAAKAKLASTQAQLKSREIDLANTRITAPFGGVVAERPVEMGDLLERGGTCAHVIDTDPMLLVGNVAEREVNDVRLAAQARATLLTGAEVSGFVSYISPEADAGTRSYRVEVEVANSAGLLRDGITAQIAIPIAAANAHKISPALLALNDEGALGVRIVDRNDVVVWVPVKIISDEGNGVWVAGLPETVRVITVGQELVYAGQRVDVALEEPLGAPDRVATAL